MPMCSFPATGMSTRVSMWAHVTAGIALVKGKEHWRAGGLPDAQGAPKWRRRVRRGMGSDGGVRGPRGRQGRADARVLWAARRHRAGPDGTKGG
eukprot:464210-Prymnesium_polylepis.1